MESTRVTGETTSKLQVELTNLAKAKFKELCFDTETRRLIDANRMEVHRKIQETMAAVSLYIGFRLIFL